MRLAFQTPGPVFSSAWCAASRSTCNVLPCNAFKSNGIQLLRRDILQLPPNLNVTQNIGGVVGVPVPRGNDRFQLGHRLPGRAGNECGGPLGVRRLCRRPVARSSASRSFAQSATQGPLDQQLLSVQGARGRASRNARRRPSTALRMKQSRRTPEALPPDRLAIPSFVALAKGGGA